MDVCKPFKELFKEVASYILFQSPPLLDVAEEVTSRAQLDYEANVLARFKLVEQTDYICMVALLQDTKL